MTQSSHARFHAQEGFETQVLAGFPFHRYMFRAITIERPDMALQKTLRRNGYRFVICHGWFGDHLWVHKNMTAETQRALHIAPGAPHGSVNCNDPERVLRNGHQTPEDSAADGNNSHVGW